MKKLWIAGVTSIGLVTALTYLGGRSLEMPVGRFFVVIAILAGLMVLVGKGMRWARWIVAPFLLFFAVSAALTADVLGFAVAAIWAASAVVFFRHRAPDVRRADPPPHPV